MAQSRKETKLFNPSRYSPGHSWVLGAQHGGTRPFVPFLFLATLPSPRAPARQGRCPPRSGKPFSAPVASPQAGQRQVLGAQGARFSGARAPWGNYRKCREKPWSFPIWSRRQQRSRCRRKGAAELESRTRAPRLHAPLPRRRARPLRRPPLLRWPRPSGGTLQLAPAELTQLQAVNGASFWPLPLVPSRRLASDLSGRGSRAPRIVPSL